MGRVVRYWIGIVILLVWINLGYCDDLVLILVIFIDFGGNIVNVNSFIKWVLLFSFDLYKVGDIEYDFLGLVFFNNFVKFFINGAVFFLGVLWGKYFNNFDICIIILLNVK